MPKVTEDYLEARRRQILDAAVACFSRKGFHQSTMHDICAEAGVSPGSLYRYFKSKEDIITEMAQDNLRRNMELIREGRQRGDVRSTLNGLADAFFGMLAEEEWSIKVDIELWAEALRNETIRDILRRSFGSHQRALEEIIEEGQRKGEFSRDFRPETVAQSLFSMFEGVVLLKSINPDIDIASYVAVVKKMIGALCVQDSMEG